MNWGMGLIFISVVACVAFALYLYQRSQNETSENEEEPTDNADDGYEDLLLTGLMLEEIYDDDDSSDDTDADGYNDGFDSGYDDGGTLE